MIGVIIVTHGDMAKGIKNAAEMIVGEKAFLYAIGYYVGESFEDLERCICATIDENRGYENWIIFSDLFGDTPSNVSSVVIAKKGGVLITDVNLSMVLQALINSENTNFEQFLDSILENGRGSIRVVTKDIILQNGQDLSDKNYQTKRR